MRVSGLGRDEGVATRMMVLGDVLEYMVAARPGRSARDLTMSLYGNLDQFAEIEHALGELIRGGRVNGRSQMGSATLVFHPLARPAARSPNKANLNASSLLAHFQSKRSDLRLVHAQLFVEIAVQEGLTVRTYARQLALPEETAQRYLLDLAGSGGQRLALVKLDSPRRDGQARCTLSLDGCRLLGRLWDAMAAA